MASLNRISLIGNVGNNPITREVKDGRYTSFSLAINEKTGYPPKEKTLWFRVIFWGNTAEIAEKFVKKGMQIYVDGRLSVSEYTDNEGITRNSLDVRGMSLVVMTSNNKGENGNPLEE